MPLSKYRGQNTVVQNTEVYNTGVKMPVVIIPYWTKYHTGQNTMLDKIPRWTKYHIGHNAAHAMHNKHYNSLILGSHHQEPSFSANHT